MLEHELVELKTLNVQMNEFKQALDYGIDTKELDQRRYLVLKSQVINLTR